MMNTLIEVALTVCLVGAVTFAVIYTIASDWQSNPVGRHMFYFGWAIVLAFATNLARVWLDYAAVDVIRVSSLYLLAVVFWQRVYLLVRTLREEKQDADS